MVHLLSDALKEFSLLSAPPTAQKLSMEAFSKVAQRIRRWYSNPKVRCYFPLGSPELDGTEIALHWRACTDITYTSIPHQQRSSWKVKTIYVTAPNDRICYIHCVGEFRGLLKSCSSIRIGFERKTYRMEALKKSGWKLKTLGRKLT